MKARCVLSLCFLYAAAVVGFTCGVAGYIGTGFGLSTLFFLHLLLFPLCILAGLFSMRLMAVLVCLNLATGRISVGSGLDLLPLVTVALAVIAVILLPRSLRSLGAREIFRYVAEA